MDYSKLQLNQTLYYPNFTQDNTVEIVERKVKSIETYPGSQAIKVILEGYEDWPFIVIKEEGERMMKKYVVEGDFSLFVSKEYLIIEVVEYLMAKRNENDVLLRKFLYKNDELTAQIQSLLNQTN